MRKNDDKNENFISENINKKINESNNNDSNIINSQNNNQQMKSNCFIKISFCLFGINSLLLWNTILADLSFFMYYQEKYVPEVSYVFLHFVLNVFYCGYAVIGKKSTKYKNQLVVYLILMIISLIVLPLSVILFEKNSLVGFIISGIILLIIGYIIGVGCTAFYGLISYFPKELIVIFSTGLGVSGITTNILQYLVLILINTGDKEKDLKLGALIFFGISIILTILCLIMLLISYKTEYFIYYLKNTDEFVIDKKDEKNSAKDDDNGKNSIDALMSASERETTNAYNVAGGSDSLIKENKKFEKNPSFCEIFKMSKDIWLLVIYLNFVTYILFPAICVSQRLFNLGKYRVNTIITIYNLSDTVGRMCVGKTNPTKLKIYLIILLRSIILFSLPFNFFCDMKLDANKILVSILLIINVFLLGITNGIGTTLTLTLVPSLVPDYLKGRIGSYFNCFTILGIFIGSSSAFGSEALLKLIGTYED